jgi:hypothetical protein
MVLCFLALTSLVWFLFPENFIADDSYFYLVIARNTALDSVQSFSGVYPTNGVHPAWQWLVSLASMVVGALDPDLLWQSRTLLFLPVVCLLVGTVQLSRIARFLALHVPTCLLIMAGYLSVFGVLFSEAHLYYVSTTWLLSLALVQGSSGRRTALLGLASAGVLLSRLDSVFLVAVFYVWYWRSERSVKPPVLSGIVCAAVVLPYLVWNHVSYGSILPISGWLKSSFPAISWKLLRHGGLLQLGFAGYRIALGILPLLGAAVLLVIFRHRLRSSSRSILWVPLGGCLLHFVYTALFTTSHSYWPWYYVLPMLSFALAAGLLVQESVQAHRRSWATTLCFGLLILAFAADKIGAGRDVHPAKSAPLRMAKDLGVTDKVILVSDYPGYLAFYSRNSVIAADMLTGNRNLYNLMSESENALDFLFDYAERQGKPIEYVFYTGNRWLIPDEGLRAVLYNDPKFYPREVVIGRRFLGRPIGRVEVSSEKTYYAWKTPTAQ